jgi:hypothetical protein
MASKCLVCFVRGLSECVCTIVARPDPESETITALRADLARVERERDEVRDRLDVERRYHDETRGYRQKAERERDEARAFNAAHVEPPNDAPDFLPPAVAFFSLPRTPEDLARRFRGAFAAGRTYEREVQAPAWAALRDACNRAERERDEALRDLAAMTRDTHDNNVTFNGLLERAEAEVERLRAALTKINGIRNSIVGVQGFNFSEHAYPLVAALNAAGFKGMPYPEARENVGTLIERATKAESEAEKLRHVLAGVMRIVADSAHGKEGHVLGRLNVLLFRSVTGQLTGDPEVDTRELPGEGKPEEAKR